MVFLYCDRGCAGVVRHDYHSRFIRDDVTGYVINLEELCSNQAFAPDQVVSSELVFPKGAVPNSRILWVRVELTNGERKFITLPLLEFYRFVQLPESSIGGWVDGDHGSDYTGLNARYEANHTGGSESVSSELFDGTERIEDSVASAVVNEDEDRSPS